MMGLSPDATGKLQGHQSFGSGEVYVSFLLTFYGHGCYLVSVPKTI